MSPCSGPGAIGVINGKKYLFASGKEGIWRLELDETKGVPKTETKLIDQKKHKPLDLKRRDVDQFGFGLRIVGNDLMYVSRMRGIFLLPNAATQTQLNADVKTVYSFQGVEKYLGLGLHLVRWLSSEFPI